MAELNAHLTLMTSSKIVRLEGSLKDVIQILVDNELELLTSVDRIKNPKFYKECVENFLALRICLVELTGLDVDNKFRKIFDKLMREYNI